MNDHCEIHCLSSIFNQSIHKKAKHYITFSNLCAFLNDNSEFHCLSPIFKNIIQN
ncbi:hypothetical protein HOLDEFILI_00837 [Holdemania filiformis DSM 12042]|uniref:Uncharacterized protein n=1 Tax=Holdemania filiformis DSM 12042 TaxID=545696 RepID=B9Y4V6_9FIRM|nr:hypothetical protein HOLDEFILI_00837 [Holdemania filiformis DSM 12042]